jgi:trigger factor
VDVVLPQSFVNAELRGRRATFHITLKEIREPNPLSIDDEFAISVGAESLDALKERIRTEHARELKTLSRMHLKRAVLDKLAEAHTFTVPKGLVENETRSMSMAARASTLRLAMKTKRNIASSPSGA